MKLAVAIRPCVVAALLAAAACGKREPAVRQHSFLTAGAPVKVSDLTCPAIVRTSTGALVLTAFIHTAFPSATEPGEAVAVLESKDDGDTWREIARVPSFVAYGVWGYDLAVDADDRLYLTWVAAVYNAATRIPLKTVMFSRADDGGRTWSKPVGVSDAPSGQRRSPALAVSGAHVGIAWLDARAEGRPLVGRSRADEDVYFAASADRGATWSADACLEKDLAAKDSRPSEPALAATPQGAFACAYFSMRKYKTSVGGFWIARSADGGATFDIDRHGAGPLGFFSLAASEGRLYLAAEFTTHVAIAVPPEPQSEVRLFTSDDDGRSWGRPVRIDEEAAGPSWKTSVRLEPAGSGRLLAAWDDHATGIVLAASLDGGETWGKTVKVAERSPVGLTPIDVAVDPATGGFYLVVGHVVKGAGDAIYLVKGKAGADEQAKPAAGGP